MMKKLIILGSTGSIGVQALEVAGRNGYKVTALAAGKNTDLLEKQARKFKPDIVAVFDEEAAKVVRRIFNMSLEGFQTLRSKCFRARRGSVPPHSMRAILF